MTTENPSPQPLPEEERTKDLGSRGQASGVSRFRIAYNALALAILRSNACILHVDGHDHGDTHCVVRIDDLLVLIEEVDSSLDHAVGRAMAESALEGVQAALDTAEELDVPLSSVVLRGILAVYSKAGEQ